MKSNLVMKKAGYLACLLFCGTTLHCSLPFSEPVETVTYFKIEYPYNETTCGKKVDKVLRVRPFTESLPFNRKEMAVLGTRRDVKLSSKNLWVGNPGDMVANQLANDLSRDGLFSTILTMGNPAAAPMLLDGKIFQFAWAEENSTARALLEVEATLTNMENGREVIYRKIYRFESDSMPSKAPENFAEAASQLVAQFSSELRTDICDALPQSDAPAPRKPESPLSGSSSDFQTDPP